MIQLLFNSIINEENHIHQIVYCATRPNMVSYFEQREYQSSLVYTLVHSRLQYSLEEITKKFPLSL